MQVILGDSEKWQIEIVKRDQMPKKTWGDCNNKMKKIRVRVDLSDQNFLDTFLHEMLHACAFVPLSEEFVERTASQMAKALLASGHVVIDRNQFRSK